MKIIIVKPVFLIPLATQLLSLTFLKFTGIIRYREEFTFIFLMINGEKGIMGSRVELLNFDFELF